MGQYGRPNLALAGFLVKLLITHPQPGHLQWTGYETS